MATTTTYYAAVTAEQTQAARDAVESDAAEAAAVEEKARASKQNDPKCPKREAECQGVADEVTYITQVY